MATNQRIPQDGEIFPERDLPDEWRSHVSYEFGRESAEAKTLAPEPATEEECIRFKYFRPLYLAAVKGDWEAAEGYFQHNNILDAFTERVSDTHDMTTLLVASYHGHTKFVENILDRMPTNRDELLRKPGHGDNTALHYAAIGGHLKMAKALIQKDPQLTEIGNATKDTPLQYAVQFFSGHELVRYLAFNTTIEVPECPFERCKAGNLMIYLTHMGFHGKKKK